MSRRVVVTGSRQLAGSAALRIWRELSRLHTESPITYLAHGGCGGTDVECGAWAIRHRVSCDVFKADWNIGPKAGPIRNRRMLVEAAPDVVIAFPGGKGTADCVRQARRLGLPVIEVAA